MKRFNVSSIVLNIPHSSGMFPLKEDQDAWPIEISHHIANWTDWYTDELFGSKDSRVVPIIFPYSRFYCDVERLIDDPLEAKGQGIIYDCFEGLTRRLNLSDIRNVMQSYQWHIERLASAIIGPETLLIDCHSFPKDMSEVEICIGVNNDWSRPSDEMLEYILTHFRKLGYRTEINTPYSNSITPQKEFLYKSFMIEVNKRLYLNDDTLDKTDKSLNRHITMLFEDFLR